MKNIALGVDIGGTYTKYGLVDINGNIYASDAISTTVYSDAEGLLHKLKCCIDVEMQKLGKDFSLVGVGVGAPNGNFYTGNIEYAPNLQWKGVVNFVEIAKKHFNLPVFLTNDANAAALGEMIFGGAKNMKNFIMITLGTGLGSGIVVNGELVYGHDGFAGELGHTLVYPNNRLCGCGKRGCLETYTSATGIKRTVYELLAESNESSELREIPYNALDSKMIYDAAKRGDLIALQAFEFTAKILGTQLSDAVAYLSPEAIFLFGGLAKADELLIKPTKKYMEENLLHVFKNKVKILPSALQDKNIAVMGASALYWKESQSEQKQEKI